MYFMEAHLYTDLFVVCGADARCLVKNDNPLAGFSGMLVLSALDVASGSSHVLNRTAVALPAGGGAAVWLCAGAGMPLADSCTGWPALLSPLGLLPAGTVLLTALEDATGATAYSSFELLAAPSAMLPSLPAAPGVAVAVGAPAPDGSSVPVTVTTAGTALFVGLTTAAHGRFSDNFFILAAGGQRVVHFLPFGELDVATLKATLRVEHVRSYL